MMTPRQIADLHSVKRFSIGLCIVGGVGVAASIVLAPERTWANLLLVSCALICLGLGSAFFIAVTTLSGGTWALPFRRVAVVLCRALIPGTVGVLLVISLHPSLYPWTHHTGRAAHGFKSVWLNYPFFVARAAGYLLLWNLLTAGLVRLCSQGRTHTSCQCLPRLSAIFVVLFAVTFSLASFDWIMSLEPGWASTIFGVYNFAGLFVETLAVMIIVAILMQRYGLLTSIEPDRLHDLGKLLFAFTTFWMYIWFSQYMLIWYTNFPEEASHFTRRLGSGWAALFMTNLLLSWVVPFLALLPRSAKRNPGVLLRVAGLVLVGRWLDLYLMIAPATQQSPAFGAPEVAPVLLSVGLVLLLIVWEHRRDALRPRVVASRADGWEVKTA